MFLCTICFYVLKGKAVHSATCTLFSTTQNQTPAQANTALLVGVTIKVCPVVPYSLWIARVAEVRDASAGMLTHLGYLQLSCTSDPWQTQLPGASHAWRWLPQRHLRATPQECHASCCTSVV